MEHSLELAREGDKFAKEAIVESLRPRMTKMAAHYARCCGEDPDDLLQEAWVGMLEALPELNIEIGCPEQYLIQRARWRLLDAIRRARVRRCLPLEEEIADAIPHSALESALDSACVSEFARQLKATQRVVLDYLMAGFTWRETGDALGCSSANIAYHVRQIRQQYKKWTAGQVVSV